MRSLRKFLFVPVSIMALALAAGEARATLVSYNLGTTFNGTTPTSPAPWLSVSFSSTAPGSVTLTLVGHLTGTEFLSQVAFNVVDSIKPSALTINPAPGNPVTTAGIAHSTQNAQKIDGSTGMGFDVLLSFPTSNRPSSNRFDNETLLYTITGSGITAASFAYRSSNSASAFVGAHVQGIPLASGSADISAVSAVPIPAAGWLFGSGLIGLVGVRRRMKRQNPDVS